MESHNFSNQQQEQIYRRLKFLVGPGAAAFYRDACRLMEMEPLLESTTHLVGHLLREIESSLRAVLKHIWELSEQSSKKKKASNENTHEAQIRTVLQALEIPEASIVAQTWLSLSGKNSEYGLHTRAHRNDLSQPRSVDQEFRQFWGDIQAVLDQLLDRFETRYSDIRGKLDELLSKPEPGDEDLKMLRLHIPNSLTGLGYFFEQLQFPGWLKKLREKGFFENPPEPEVNFEGGGKRFFRWPQSRYLAQMASHEPETVLDIALKILETRTKNVIVHEDLAQAALAMPPELAARWVEKETEWLREQGYLDDYLADKLCELVNYLTHENQVDTALSLLRELLAVLPASQSSSSLGEPSTRLNEYYYNELLQNNVPKLREVAGEGTFKMLCDLLEEAVRLSASPDYSHHWRASIKDNPNGIRELLISAVRDATEHLAENNPVAVRTLVPVLESYNRTIFQRLSLHLLYRFPNESQELIEERLTNCERFQNQGELYEYKLLMKEQFSNLSSEAQETIFTWIAEGAIDKPSLSTADRALYIKSWQRGWLAILSDYLTEQLQQQYEQLVSELGPVEPLEPVGGIRLLKVSRSPKTSAELASMSMTELLAFLKQWQPSGNLLEPSRNGLGWELFQVITQNPETFVRESEQFKELDTEYKRWFLCGLRQALTTHQQRQGFPWFEILEFCSWILAQQHQTSECEVPNSAIDREWNQTCEAVIDVITEGLQATAENQIPLELRTQVWTILEQLTDDPRVTPGFEAQYRRCATFQI
ncbi:hypothetical protein H6F74_28195 [Trichocoleus sp. FACHB-90]|uniref:hypothetical protein n=1 Tax=Cyanophyceae TaxID=3028117 RepID=UPI00168614EA|nr:hypothetical protein [Trichocoleus sp. FACHB-90]MBD1930076.1 hypothetical protein [Trichocoleus sp. FACHB-90]